MTRPGWLRLWRKIVESPHWKGMQSGDGRAVMVALLCAANYEDSEMQCSKCGHLFHLQRGDALVSLAGLAGDACTTRDVARTAIKRLTSGRNSFATVVSRCRHRTIYRINKYAEYNDNVTQPHVAPTVTPSHPHLTPTSPPHEKEERRRTEEEKEARALPESTFGDQPHERLAIAWLSALKASKPSHRNVLTPQAVAASRRPYAQACQQLLKRGDAKRIEAVRDWAWTRDFWRSKTRTPGQLVKVWDKVTDEMPEASARPPADPRRAIERTRQEAAQRRGEAPLPEVDQLSLRIYKAEQQVASLRSARVRGETGAAERCAEAEEKLRGLRNALVRAARG